MSLLVMLWIRGNGKRRCCERELKGGHVSMCAGVDVGVGQSDVQKQSV